MARMPRTQPRKPSSKSVAPIRVMRVGMHVKQAKMHGERELRLYHLPVWRESTLFSPRERAALA